MREEITTARVGSKQRLPAETLQPERENAEDSVVDLLVERMGVAQSGRKRE